MQKPSLQKNTFNLFNFINLNTMKGGQDPCHLVSQNNPMPTAMSSEAVIESSCEGDNCDYKQ